MRAAPGTAVHRHPPPLPPAACQGAKGGRGGRLDAAPHRAAKSRAPPPRIPQACRAARAGGFAAHGALRSPSLDAGSPAIPSGKEPAPPPARAGRTGTLPAAPRRGHVDKARCGRSQAGFRPLQNAGKGEGPPKPGLGRAKARAPTAPRGRLHMRAQGQRRAVRQEDAGERRPNGADGGPRPAAAEGRPSRARRLPASGPPLGTRGARH